MSYLANGTIAVGATKTPLILGGSATTLMHLLALCCSLDGAPSSDVNFQFKIARTTTLGTSTSVTPALFGGLGPAAVGTAGSNCTVEPTYTPASGPIRGYNPRATPQWQAYDKDAEIASLPSASNGIGIQCVQVGGAIGNFIADATWREG